MFFISTHYVDYLIFKFESTWRLTLTDQKTRLDHLDGNFRKRRIHSKSTDSSFVCLLSQITRFSFELNGYSFLTGHSMYCRYTLSSICRNSVFQTFLSGNIDSCLMTIQRRTNAYISFRGSHTGHTHSSLGLIAKSGIQIFY